MEDFINYLPLYSGEIFLHAFILHLFREIRECLKLDPEHKACFPHYKKIKKIDKLMTDSEEAISSKEYKSCNEKAKKVS